MSGHGGLPSFAALTGEMPRVKIVDIGANPIDGEPPYAELMREGNTSVIGFEPNPQALEKLHGLRRAQDTYLPHAVGDGGRHTLHICAAPGMTSLLAPDPAVLDLFHGFPHWGQVVATEEVATVRLDDVAETAGVDLLKMDIQGAELMVMRHAERRLADAVVIHAEVEFLPLYKGQPLFTDIDLFLRERGFVLHRFHPTVSRMIRPLSFNNDPYAGMSQLVWADAVFVRDFTALERLTDHQLVAMAAILHDCYRSLDLVVRLLLAYDRRSGKALATAYLDRLRGSAAAAGAAA